MTIRWGIVGCGDVVRKRVAAAIVDDPGSTLEAACRRSQAELKKFCEQFGVSKAYAEAEDLIADDAIDAVYLATPVRWHEPHTRLAAAAGKHVLVEKPMGLNVPECEAMIESCDKAGVKLGVAYYRRFYPLMDRIKEILQTGELGPILTVSATTANPFALQPGDEGYWRVELPEGGGGALMDIGSHRANLFFDLLGRPSVVKSVCDARTGDYDAERLASVLLQFDSGPLGILQCLFGTKSDPDEFVVHCANGRMVARPLNGSELEIHRGRECTIEHHAPPENFCGPLIADFVEAIRTDRPPRVDGREGRETNDILERAYRDAGLPVVAR